MSRRLPETAEMSRHVGVRQAHFEVRGAAYRRLRVADHSGPVTRRLAVQRRGRRRERAAAAAAASQARGRHPGTTTPAAAATASAATATAAATATT